MTYIIKAKELKKSYGDFSLHIDSLDIEAGKITGLVGKNGAGKTTLIDLLLGLRKADRGTIQIAGFDGARLSSIAKEDLGFVIESANFHDCLSSIDIERVFKRIYRNWDSTRFYELIGQFGINKTLRYKELSKGSKAKLIFAVALAHKSKLIIMDEPTSGVDPAARNDLLGFLCDYIKDSDNSVLFSTHIVSDISNCADDLLILSEGELLYQGTISYLLDTLSVRKQTDHYHEEDYTLLSRTRIVGEETILTKRCLDSPNDTQSSLEDIILHILEGRVKL